MEEKLITGLWAPTFRCHGQNGQTICDDSREMKILIRGCILSLFSLLHQKIDFKKQQQYFELDSMPSQYPGEVV
jgi:hypothetical protein